jgi:cyclopropane-fatty-acyl-phospholipid synthase
MTALCLDSAPVAGAPRSFRAVVAIMARRWTAGSLTFLLPDGAELRVGGRGPGPDAVLRVRSFRFVGRALAAGDIGLAEGYVAGEWDTPDLTGLLTAFALNFDQLAELVRGNPLVRLVEALRHALRRNTRAGSRQNIQAHYDLGEAFYRAWLDPGMTYSAALYADGSSLQEAQRNKYRALADATDLQPGARLLEIGCGWGGFAEYAAQERGALVTAVTISQDQYAFARRRVFRQGLAERVDIRLADYRDVQGVYDRVASIEMFEAVGEPYWPTFFDKVRNALRPGGCAGVQVITIRDDLYEDYRRQTDFIQKYIFPGGSLPSELQLRCAATAAGFEWADVRRFGADYARTLSEWTTRFEAAWGEISGLGFNERFQRLWRFYLAYCEAGFSTARTDVIQCVLRRV